LKGVLTYVFAHRRLGGFGRSAIHPIADGLRILEIQYNGSDDARLAAERRAYFISLSEFTTAILAERHRATFCSEEVAKKRTH
jgi:hypothetical protein